MEVQRKNILLIAGTGRNVGKTMFACNIIKCLSNQTPITSIKISPHFHELSPNLEIISQNENYLISKENKKEGEKDSNRLLNAGSKEVYYVQAKDEFLTEILSYFDCILDPTTPIICESGALRDIIQPGLFLMIDKKNNNNLKPRAIGYKQLANEWIEFDGEEFDFTANKIAFSNNEWVIKKLTT